MPRAVARYREYAPSEALREHVSAFFSFSPPRPEEHRRAVTCEVVFGENDSFCSPLFAAANVSVVFSFGESCSTGGPWHPSLPGPRGDVIGGMSCAGVASPGERQDMMGAYFRPGREFPFIGAPSCELTDRVVALDDLWGRDGAGLAAELGATEDGMARIDRLESVLLARLGKARAPRGALNVHGIADWVLRQPGRLSVRRLADAAGVSRQHLARVFRESIGVPPKLFCRVARYQAGLAYVGCGEKVDWAQAALELGYTDQSHMIAEFRRFSSLTPEALARGRWFHPFIERARGRSAMPVGYNRRGTFPNGR